jgi:hypothetical protein
MGQRRWHRSFWDPFAFLAGSPKVTVTQEVLATFGKGYLDHRSRVQLKRMRIYYPRVQVVVIDRRFFQPCEAQGRCRLIEGYACRHHPECLETSP